LLLTVTVALGFAGSAWAGAPPEQLRTYTDQVMKVLENPALTAPERVTAVRTVANEVFDIPETARRALGVHWQQQLAG
jgi:TPP-dependent trihydroxycyclohexane-1,2-dione (THcHDO) dehydratase